MDDKRFIEALEQLVPALRNIADVADAQLKQSTLLESVLRGKLNGLLFAGMIQLQGSAGNWTYEVDYTVNYASVGFIDSLGAGPYTISVDSMGGSNGPGTFQTGDVLAATVPMIGQHLSITSDSESDTAPQLFIAVFTETQPLIAQ
jgi:hypothetical protein